MKRHRRDLEVMSDLNPTNMIDTAFVLLIVFILVAPAMKSGLPLDLPQVQGEPSVTDVNNSLIIAITKANPPVGERIALDGEYYTVDELREIVTTRKLANSKLEIIIEADRASTYETFAQVIGVLKQSGIESIGLSTDPVDAAALAEREKNNRQSGNRRAREQSNN